MFITTRNQNGPLPLLALTKGVSDTSTSRRGSAVRVVTDQSARTRDDGACSVGDETTQGVDQPGRCVRADRLRDAERVQGIELARESVRVARHGDRPESLETACSSALVLVAVLAERRAPRHHEQRLAQLQRGEDRPHACVGHNRIGAAHPLSTFSRLDELSELDVAWEIRAGTDLRETLTER